MEYLNLMGRMTHKQLITIKKDSWDLIIKYTQLEIISIVQALQKIANIIKSH